MARKATTQTPPATNADIELPQHGETIRYYKDGWRTGTFLDIAEAGKTARVQPILAHKRPVTIALTDIQRSQKAAAP